jgi:hypothetical protein
MHHTTFELARRTLGRWPAAPLIAGSYAVTVAGRFVIPQSIVWVPAVAVLAFMVIYCWARPTERLGTFWLWISPGPAAGIADATGLPAMPVWIVVALLAVAVAVDQDREERRARAQLA